METSIKFSAWIAIALSLAGCTARSSAIDFAISTPALSPSMRVGETRVLASQVNLREPVYLGVHGEDVTVTFAVRERRGMTFTLDPAALATRASTPFDYQPHAPRAQPAYFPLEPVRVALRDHRVLSCWTDEATSRVIAQLRDEDGTALGPEITVSGPTLDVIGPPRAVTRDGTRVVVAFFAVTPVGFDLVTTSLDAL